MSLIEMIVVIVVIGLAIPVLTKNWADVTMRGARSEAMTDASLIASQLMEEITAKRFDEVVNPPWTQPNLFGARRSDESGENTRAQFDDVDDFAGYANTTPNGLTQTVQVAYANLTGTQWTAETSITNYKRIVVSVSKSRLGVNNVTVTTIVGRY